MRLDDKELDLLAGHGASSLSHAAKLAYILGIRPFMDYSTGLVGYKRRISYQSLSEVLEFAPVRGSQRKEQRFGKEAIRSIFKELERVGLIRWIKNEDRCLFFECLAAHRDNSPEMRNNPRTTPSNNPMNNPEKPSKGAGLNGFEQPHEQQTHFADEQPTSGLPGNTGERERRGREKNGTDAAMPGCIPQGAWDVYEQERNLKTGRVMSINQRLALWQQLTAMDAEGFDLNAVLRDCVAQGFARFERRQELRKKPLGATNQTPGASTSTQTMKRGNYAGHQDIDKSAAGRTRRDCERWEAEQAANCGRNEPGRILEGEFDTIPLRPSLAAHG
jgi:hypothetical protein